MFAIGRCYLIHKRFHKVDENQGKPKKIQLLERRIHRFTARTYVLLLYVSCVDGIRTWPRCF